MGLYQLWAASALGLAWSSFCTVMDGPDTQRIFRPAGREGERRAGSLSRSVLERSCTGAGLCMFSYKVVSFEC